MALEAVVFPQDPFGYGGSKDLYNLVNWSYEFGREEGFLGNQTENSPSHSYCQWNSSLSMAADFNEFQYCPSNDPSATRDGAAELAAPAMEGGGGGRARRRRLKSRKNKEEMENQRMSHITVERNRRKQMNEYLSVLRSLMPESYVQRGDQASIIGGAINFVKQLEQQVQSLTLSAQTHVKPLSNGGPISHSLPFSHFFTFPQYSSTLTSTIPSPASSSSSSTSPHPPPPMDHAPPSSVADIEVSLVDSHANIKIRSQKLPKQLLKIVSGLHGLRLSVLHLNVSTAGQIVLYTLSVKVEEDCRISSVDEIARALYQLMSRIQEEAFSI